MEWFVNLQFLAGLVIGASFGLVGGLLLGLVVGSPIATEIMAAEGSANTNSVWQPLRSRSRADEGLDMSPPAEPVGTRRQRTASSEAIDMSPPAPEKDQTSPLPLVPPLSESPGGAVGDRGNVESGRR